ncbi:MAG: PspC domain-containing protein [Bacteroidaceae bacterium]|nr:PspC domain-containing protein [Bacteroidaceae bacterium]MBR6749859.1 PspC domain-containing protein [Bacteroidaceae bacterium]
MSETKKLVRVREGKKIAGVCLGLAKYMGVDPTVVRLIAVIALLFGSLGFWMYILAWLVMPEE